MTTHKNFQPFSAMDANEEVCLFLDGELSLEHAKKIEFLIDSSSKYQEIYNEEKAYRELLKTKFQPKKISSDFLQDIKAQISNL